jgi:hypothetical protein
MTSEAEVYDTLKYRVEVDPQTGARRYYNTAGQLHREDGPAIIFPNSAVVWFQNGLRHCKDGPAIIWANGDKEWWVHGVNYTEAEFNLRFNTPGHTV